MNPKATVAIGLAAIFVAVIAMPNQAAFAATVDAQILKGSSTATTPEASYAPYPIEVNQGDTVVWANTDSTIHTVTSGTGSPDGLFGVGEDGATPVLVAPNKTFQYTFTEEGNYPYFCMLHAGMTGLVKVAGGAGNGDAEETTVEAELDGNTYEVTGKATTAVLSSVEIFEEEAVEVEFEDGGEVELTLPKAMIDGIDAVVAGEEELDFTKVSETDTSTTIKFTVPEDETLVEITGSFVVPEFGVIAALVLAVSLVAVIGFARFKGNSFGLGRF